MSSSGRVYGGNDASNWSSVIVTGARHTIPFFLDCCIPFYEADWWICRKGGERKWAKKEWYQISIERGWERKSEREGERERERERERESRIEKGWLNFFLLQFWLADEKWQEKKSWALFWWWWCKFLRKHTHFYYIHGNCEQIYSCMTVTEKGKGLPKKCAGVSKPTINVCHLTAYLMWC